MKGILNNPGRKTVLVVVCLAWSLGLFSGAGLSLARAEGPDLDGWEFSAAAHGWLPAMNGELTVMGQTSTLDVTLQDLLENLDFGAMLHLEARRNRLAFYLNPMLVTGSVSQDLGFLDLEMRARALALEFGALYRLYRSPTGGSGPRLNLEVLAGGRYVNLRGELALLGLSEFGQNKNWLDPVLGLRFRVDLNEHLSLTLDGDVGGFGIGSRVSLNAMALIGYRFNRRFSLWVGYRVLHMDYQDGPDPDRFAWDVTMAGPMLGGRIDF